jgi:hypothetical protein
MDQNLKDILETVNFIKDHMLTKEDGVTKDELPDLIRPIVREEVEAVVRPVVREIVREEISENVRPIVREEIIDALKPIEDRLTSVESKISGTNRRLDEEAMQRQDLKLPKRVSNLEEKTFGASRHPAHIPLK